MTSEHRGAARRPRLGLRGFLLIAAVVAVVVAGLALRSQRLEVGPAPTSPQGVLQLVPAETMLTVRVDLAGLRGSEVGKRLLGEGREAAGISEVQKLCGGDPMRGVDELVVAIPAANMDVGFGVFGLGSGPAEQLLSCAQRLIAARGGKAVREQRQGFVVVRDGSGTLSEVALAVSPEGKFILAEGDYMQAALAVSKEGAPSLAQQADHQGMRNQLQAGSVVATAVLSAAQRATLQEELAAQGMASSPFTSVVGGGLRIRLGADVEFSAILKCTGVEPCGRIATVLEAARHQKANETVVHLLGLDEVLGKMVIGTERQFVRMQLRMPLEQALRLIRRVLALRKLGASLPSEPPKPPDGKPLPSARPAGSSTNAPSVAPASSGPGFVK